MADRVNQRFGDYLLTRFLGRGTFGDVYLGEHVYNKTQAAVKVFKTQLTLEKVKDFINEVSTLLLLKHPNIVQLLHFGIGDNDIPYLVMEYAPNGVLLKRHPRGTRLPLPTVVIYVKQIAAALQYAHDQRRIHRDVKPENMLFGAKNEIVLSDFGIAVVAHNPSSQKTEDAIGTAVYMAPEQWRGKPLPATDQYALGVIVYEWLCGERPFKGDSLQLMYQHINDVPPPLRGKVATIPAEVEQVVMRTLEKDPQQRFKSVQAFANALEQTCLAAQPATVRSAPLSIFDSPSREPDDPSDLPFHPHEKVFPTQSEKSHLGSSWQIVGASRRGYGHAYEGKYREDDFQIRLFSPSGSRSGNPREIALVAIADGVSSKTLSRRGARAAALGITGVPDQDLQVLASLLGNPLKFQDCQNKAYYVLMDVFNIARINVEECAFKSHVSVDELQSTLMVFLAAPWDDQYLFVASTQVGNGALFLLQQSQYQSTPPHEKWNWIQQPQIQGAGNEVQPFMRADINAWAQYFRCNLYPTAAIMGMTDGTADDIEPPRPTPEDPNPDPFSMVDDFYQRIVHPTFQKARPGEELVRLLTYKKKRSFGDRTVICLYRH